MENTKDGPSPAHETASHHTLAYLTGSVIIWWGRIESVLYGDVMRRSRQPFAAVTAVQGAANLINEWQRSTESWFAEQPKVITEIDAIADGLRNCDELRQVIVHGYRDYPHGSKFESSAKVIRPGKEDEIKLTSYELTADRLERLLGDVVRLYDALIQLPVDRRQRHMRP